MEAKISEISMVHSVSTNLAQAVEAFQYDGNKAIRNGFQPVGDYKWAIINGEHFISQQFIKR